MYLFVKNLLNPSTKSDMLKKTILVLLFIPAAAFLFYFKRPAKQQLLKKIIIDAGQGVMPKRGQKRAKGSF
ncbi:MAG: hypothetical protein ACXWV9_10485 [Flavisolibacter sp.]